MALSAELKKLYSSNTVGVKYYDTLELSHRTFNPIYIVRDQKSHLWLNENGYGKTFNPYPFTIVLPEIGSAQQDLSVVFDSTDQELMRLLEEASKFIGDPIQIIYRVYIDGTNVSQTTPLKLVMTNIVSDINTVRATATRPDLYARKIPSGILTRYDQRFEGLFL